MTCSKDMNLLFCTRHIEKLELTFRSIKNKLLGGRHKEGRIRGTSRDPASLKHHKGKGRIAADVVLNIGI